MISELGPKQGAVFDLTRRAKIRVTGADRLRYLNGQISNDIRKAGATTAIHACVLNAKGRVNADVFITTDGDSYLVDTDYEMREQLVARLERYAIADDVEITDVTHDLALLHIVGPDTPPVQSAVAMPRAERYGCGGIDIWLPRPSYDKALQELLAELPFCDEATAETFRIEQGVPRWGHELSEEIIPTEANLEGSAIDYAKGCYIGQEVISRIKMSGQTNKRLCGFVALGAAPLESAMRLTTSEGKDVGSITSAAISRRLGKQIGLGFVKRGFTAIGTRLDASVDGADSVTAVEITGLPFV
ncbi:MAG: folate-binding protein YgfZ [Chthoniobacterales bacterium]|nr:folate-binding protein YgfZ [Chthoniobacterales bacterium]